MTNDIIQGPLGDFAVPSAPPETRRICEGLSRGVWDGWAHIHPGGEYEHFGLPKDVATVLDIGAGWGAFAVWARKRWPGCSVEGFEPHAEAVELFGHNAPWAMIHRVAVTTNPSARYRREEDWGCVRTYDNGDGNVDVACLHPRALPAADVVKIDAEGVELEVLSAYEHLATVKAVMYEFHRREHREPLRAICASAGLFCLSDACGPWGLDQGVAIWVRR